MAPPPIIECTRHCRVDTAIGWFFWLGQDVARILWKSFWIWPFLCVAFKFVPKSKIFSLFTWSFPLELLAHEVLATLTAAPAPQPHCSSNPHTAFPSLSAQLLFSFTTTYLCYIFSRKIRLREWIDIPSLVIFFGLPFYVFLGELYNQEHTFLQCFCGSLFGIVLGLFRILVYLRDKKELFFRCA
jgi:hypothetical protein